jgi:hypothetical protein
LRADASPVAWAFFMEVEIRILQLFLNAYQIFFLSAVNCLKFFVMKLWIWISIQPKIPYPESMNPDEIFVKVAKKQ